jgi:hypothetical protein
MFQRLRSMFLAGHRRRAFEDGMSEELRFHIQQYAEDRMRSGVSREEAYRSARLEFGWLNSVKENCREARGLHLFDEVGRDLRYAARLLRKAPASTVTALLTMQRQF